MTTVGIVAARRTSKACTPARGCPLDTLPGYSDFPNSVAGHPLRAVRWSQLTGEGSAGSGVPLVATAARSIPAAVTAIESDATCFVVRVVSVQIPATDVRNCEAVKPEAGTGWSGNLEARAAMAGEGEAAPPPVCAYFTGSGGAVRAPAASLTDLPGRLGLGQANSTEHATERRAERQFQERAAGGPGHPPLGELVKTVGFHTFPPVRVQSGHVAMPLSNTVRTGHVTVCGWPRITRNTNLSNRSRVVALRTSALQREVPIAGHCDADPNSETLNDRVEKRGCEHAASDFTDGAVPASLC